MGSNCEPPPIPGDFDTDGDVDLDDFAVLNDCLADPNELPSPSEPGVTVQDCLDVFDYLGDDDVDLEDFRLFQLLTTRSP